MALARPIRMRICPSCARERDERDILCVHCGHVETRAGVTPAAPVVSPPAAQRAVHTTRNVVLGLVAIGVAASVALPMLRSTRREARQQSAAATSITVPVARVPAPIAESELTAPPKWKRTRQSRWATDGSQTMGFELQAERDVAVYMDRVRPVLAVRCISKSTEVFIVLQSSASVENAGDTHTVKISLDGEPDVEEHWIDSTDKQALFAPNGEALAARMAASRRLRFSFKPFNAAPAAVDFDVHGLDQPLAAMSKTCRRS